MTRLSFFARIALAAVLPALPLACGFPDTYGGFDSNGTTGSGGSAPIACPTGMKDCNANAADGCEVNIGNDAKHCGDCMTECDSTNGTASCVDKVCQIKCGNGYADCDGLATNGCEVNTGTDPTHCGSCMNLCPSMGATATCTVGKCGFTCTTGFGDCDMKPENGCETKLDTNTDCGGCGTPCSYMNAQTTCATGTCELVCSAPFADCDNNKANGCEADTSMDAGNCGKCGAVCGIQNATAACDSGKCVEMCAVGFDDCNKNPADGCEAKLTNNIVNCGSCGNTCAVANGTGTCSGMSCLIATCNSPNKDCNGMFADGCEVNTDTDAGNCGGCGKTCSNANGPTACVGGMCSPTCNMGFADCDGNPANGCETSTNNVNNCGGCGILCKNTHASSATCPGGTCVLACTAPFKDCDGVGANGCEDDTSHDDANCGTCNTACSASTPFCIASSCVACMPDGDEADEDVQAPIDWPAAPPPPANMKPFDPSNTFPLTGRSVSHTYTFTNETDVDVHYLNISDALWNSTSAGQAAGWTVQLSAIPAGAVYELDTYYFCTVSPFNSLLIYSTAADSCDPNNANTSSSGNWFVCENPAPALTYSEFEGVKCNFDVPGKPGGKDTDDSGILQIAVSIKTPPPIPTCATYTLTVQVQGFAQQ